MSLASVLALGGSGLGFRYVLRLQTRENCFRIADLFAALASRRLTSLTAEARTLANALPASAPDFSATSRRPDAAHPRSVVCSWALYDGEGRRLASEQDPGRRQALQALGIGVPRLQGSERARMAAARGGRFALHLAPLPRQVFAIHYVRVQRGEETLGTLQVAAEMGDPALRGHDRAGGVRVVLRPILGRPAAPQTVRIDGRPHLVVHRPLTYHGQQLGTITAAIDFEREVRYEHGALLAIVAVVSASLVVLCVISWQLSDLGELPGLPDEADGAPSGSDTVVAAVKELPGHVLEFLADAVGLMNARSIAHARRVADLACAAAREMSWDAADVRKLRLAALLHDIGKPNVEALGHAALADDPRLREHPVATARMLSGLAGCEDIVRAVLHHHEHYDGTGYPVGSSGSAIPAMARLIAIADFYVALMWNGGDEPLMAHAEAITLLRQHGGSLLDPVFVEAFVRVVQRRPTPPPSAPAPAPDDGESPTLASLQGIVLTRTSE